MIKVGKVGMIDIESIKVTERARKEMGDLDGLENNLKESGLIAPIAVKDNKDGTYTLLAGERRFTVLKRNGVTEVPARICPDDLTALQMNVIEKSDTFFRKDMTWYELDKLTLEIHRMQQQLHGVKAPGPGSEGWTVQDTGDMMGGVSKASVSQSIRRAEALEAFPDAFEKCKTAADATKLLKKMDEAVIKQAIAQKLESTSPNSSLTKLSNCFIVKDFFEGVKEIPDRSIHFVEIDPPYGIDLRAKKKSLGESQYQLESYNEVDASEYEQFLSKTFSECYRVMSKHSWLICWFAPEPWFNTVYNLLTSSGFNTTRMVGIWPKGAGQNMNPSTRLSNSYEMFFYAWKGNPALNRAGRSNLFQHTPVPASKKTHPTERPIDLMFDIYETFCFPGSRILIPFLGSGNGLIAAHKLGLSPVGFELSKSYKDSFLVKLNSMAL